MARNSVKFDPVQIPSNVSVTSKGYVYYNATTEWVVSKSVPKKKYADHSKKLIGKLLQTNADWKQDRRMIPNKTYFMLFEADKLPEQPEKADNISVGVYSAVQKLSETSGLNEVLSKVFEEEDAQLILDLAMYMLIQESAVFQHFPHWCRNHAIFSEIIRSDSYICKFQQNSLSVSKINLFKQLWVNKVIDDGKLYFCYDSSNVNSLAEGVFLVQKEHAKDDSTLDQVNSDYVVRQRDGLPVTFTTFPGSIVDMAEASEMIEFFKKLLEPSRPASKITLICDRGYISEGNVLQMDECGINFLLMLRKNMGITERLMSEYADAVRSSANYIQELDQYGMTVEGSLFGNDRETRYFHIIWNSTLEIKHRKKLFSDIEAMEKRITKSIKRKITYTADELRKFNQWFDLETEEAESVIVKQRGRGAGKETEKTAYKIKSFTRNFEIIDKNLKQCGIYILVTSEPMSLIEALEAYSKRDCVEKVFRALKSFLGMDKLGVDSDDSIHAKTMIWFVAAILHSLIFNNTAKLRLNDRKSFTVPAVIDLLEEISADKDLNTGEYIRRYKPIKKQNSILDCLGLKISQIDECIKNL